MHERTILAAAIALAFALSGTTVARADDPAYAPGPWHYRAVSCVDTTVTEVVPRVVDPGQHAPYGPEAFKAAGVVVTFASGLGVRPVFPKLTASVVHYQDTAGNDVMAAEKPGDRVQLCFLGGPAPTGMGRSDTPGDCDPDTDERGRQYRVWDYAQSKSYVGFNAEHLCGGA